MTGASFDIRIRALVEGIQNVSQLAAELVSTGQQANAVGVKAGGAGSGLKNLSDGAKSASDSSKTLSAALDPVGTGVDKLVGLVKQAVVALVAFAAVSSLKDAADTAARVETLGVTLGVVGKNAGYTQGQLNGYVEETKNLGITTEAAQNAVLQFIQAGLKLEPTAAGGASGVAKLARAAQDLAVVTGENSSQTLSRLITNIQQLDVEGLRFVGIIVDQTVAQEKFATEAKKSVGALTTQEKQQALYNETLNKSAAFSGAYEASLETTGKKLSSLSRLQAEASLAIGEKLLPAYNAVVVAVSNFLGYLQKSVKGFDASGQAAKAFGDAIRDGFSFIGEIGAVIIKALAPILPALENIKNKFNQAFAGESLRGILPVLKAIVDAVVVFAVAVINAYAEAMPAIKGVFDQLVAVGVAFYDLATAAYAGWSAILGAVNGGNLLKTVFETLGLIIAGVRDGFSILGATFEIVGGVILGVAALVVEGWSKLTFLFPSLSKSLKEVAVGLREQSDAAIEGGKKTFEAFAKGDTAVAKYAQSLKAIAPAAEDAATKAIAAQTKANKAYADADAVITSLAKKQTDGLKGEEFAKALAAATAEVKKLGNEGGLTQKQLDTLNKSLEVLKNKGDEVAQAFKLLNITAEEIKTGIDQAGSTALSAFNTIAQSGTQSAQKIYDAFKLALDFDKSLPGLKGFGEALQENFNKGRISADEFRSGLSLVSQKFDELFDKQVKTAKTKTDFDELRQKVQALGAAGTISGAQMMQALDSIKEKSSGAKDAVKALSDQAVALAEEGAKVSTAELDVTKATLAVKTAQAAVTAAEINDKKQGTALSKAQLDAAKAELELKKQQEILARLLRDEELAAMNELVAKQRQLNAEKALALDPNNPALIAAAKAAKDEADAKQLVVDKIKQQVAEQQSSVATAEEQVAITQQEVDAQNKLTDAAKKTDSVLKAAKYDAQGWLLDDTGQRFEALGISVEYVQKRLEEAGASMAAARGEAQQLFDTWGKSPIDAFVKVDEAVKRIADSTKAAKDQADALSASYQASKDAINGAMGMTASQVGQATIQMQFLGSASGEVDKAMRAIRADAESVAQAAMDAAHAFVNSARGIHEELLTATGNEEAAAASRYDSRKRDLQLEYQLLEVKIKIAIATAKAAGVDTGGLEESLNDAKQAQRQALADLKQLEEMEKAKIVARKAEEARQAHAAADKAAADAKAAADYKAQQLADAKALSDAKAAADYKAQQLADAKALSDARNQSGQPSLSDLLLQQVSAAKTFTVTLPGLAAPASQTPSKIVQVNFTDNRGTNIPVTVDAVNVEPLLALLQRAKGVAA
jgi:hypothetical protein